MTKPGPELTDTERLIISYINSHPPEECMLDKITRGTSRSRATVLKYLEILNAKGIINYRFVGRSKLWSLTEFSKTDIKPGPIIKSEIITRNTDTLASVASQLHNLIYKESDLKKFIDNPETLVFTLNSYQDIIATNDTFETFFNGKNNLQEMVNPRERIVVDNAINSLKAGHSTSLEIDFMEKSNVYRPYKISIHPIVGENNKITGTTIIGDDLSQSKRTKRELEILLSIARSTSSREGGEQTLKEVVGGLNRLLPTEYCGIFLKNGGRLNLQYQIPALENSAPIVGTLEEFVSKSMDSLETVSAVNGDLNFEKVKSHLKNSSLFMMLSVPIISEDHAIGAIVLLTQSKSVNSVNIENLEMASDELSGFFKIKRLTHEKNEYINTLVAMNNVSSVLNSTTVEDEILTKSVTSTIDKLGFDMGCIYLTDDKEELALKVHENLPENLRNMCIAGIFKDLFKKTLENQTLVYITSESADYDLIDPSIKKNGVKTLLILPIKSGEKIIGLLNMGSRNVKTYNQTSLENLSSIGLQLGLALERSRLALELNENG
ncbi:GAF domain-containing protein [Methanobacterium formicicum]|uniref:GAF domain-containing protein n=1 Tax=Methanobacterium formicicum (strain DSM 3637 / PP1) TaxID=1204725 RepID=K2R1A2_METFP|nr:GAF domain-containing protein [Methanobacterium formicicum]EKF86293.1 GAF domain-containing protein [Methanobacterium formicicum DSM 3637]